MSRLYLSFLAVIFLAGCGESIETRKQRFLEQGNAMVRRQNTEEAIRLYEAALALDSCFADAWNNLGTVYFNSRDYSRAIQHYGFAIMCRPGYVAAHLNRANAYYETGELHSALADIRRVEAKEPDTITVHFLKGLILTKWRDFDGAITAFQKGLATDPENYELKVNIGTVYYYRRQYDSARSYLAAMLRNRQEPNALNTLALVETASGNYEDAMDWIDKALTERPNDPYFLNNRGFIRLMKGDVPGALEDINNSISLDPYNGWAYRNKGIYYLRMSRGADALEMFTRAEELDPHIEDIYYYLSEAHWMLNNRRQACEYIRKSIDAGEGITHTLRSRCPEIKRDQRQ